MLLYSFFAFLIIIISWICVFNGCECVVNDDGQDEEVETTFDGIDGLIDLPNLDTFNSKNGQPFDGGNELVYHDEQMEFEPSLVNLKFELPKGAFNKEINNEVEPFSHHIVEDVRVLDFGNVNGMPSSGAFNKEINNNVEPFSHDIVEDVRVLDFGNVNGMPSSSVQHLTDQSDSNFCAKFKIAYAEYSKTMKYKQIAEIFNVDPAKNSSWKRKCGKTALREARGCFDSEHLGKTLVYKAKYGPTTDPNFCENFKRAYAEYSKTMKDNQIATHIYKISSSKICYWKNICGIEFKLKKKMMTN